LAQGTALEVLRRIPEYDADRSTLESWIAGFAANAARSHWRSELGRRERLVSLGDVDSFDVVKDEDRRLDLLCSALKSLDPLDRELLQLRFVLGLSSQEIADRSDMNAPQVRKRVSRAVERLRQHPAVARLFG
jgi:RNA polymerase sigma factor (sigma-70 family)